MKRPVSVWLSQVLLIIVFVLSLLAIIYSIQIVVASRGATGVIQFDLIFILAWIIIWVISFDGMQRRKTYGRWLTVVMFFSIGVIMSAVFFGTRPFQREYSFFVELATYSLMFCIFVLPFFVLALSLAVSRRVKMFFDPSLIPQVDESSAIFTDPPPPPRFDE